MNITNTNNAPNSKAVMGSIFTPRFFSVMIFRGSPLARLFALVIIAYGLGVHQAVNQQYKN
jgi:hypothetical protein